MPKRLLGLFFLFISVCSYSQINTNRVLSIGKNALYFEDYILSIQYFNQVIRVKPYMAEPYFFRAVAKINLEDYQGAEQDCSLALERNPFLVRAYHCRGVARINQAKYKEAIEDFDKGLEFDTENKVLLLCKGISYLQGKDMDAAIADFSSAIEKHPKFTDAYLNRGRAYLDKEDTLSALGDFEKALRLDKFNPDAYASRGIIFYLQKNYQDALADYNEAIRLEPRRPGYYINRGLVRYYLNDLRGTMSDYDNVIQLDPNNVLAYYNRGLLRAEVGDINRAIDDFDRVMEFEPDNYMALYNRALLKIEIGQSDGAIKDINTVLKAYPDFYPLYYSRAEAKRKMRDMKGAEKDFATAMLMERNAGQINQSKQGNKEDEDKTREKSDKNIKKFNRLVVAGKEEEERRISYKNEIRGKIQNVNFNIDIEPIFLLSYYKKEMEIKKVPYFNKELSKLNKSGELPHHLEITNSELPLSKTQIEKHFASIEAWTRKLDGNPHYLYFFGRANDFELIQDYQSAIEDYNRAAETNPDFWLAYFNRANIRHKKMEYEASLSNKKEEDIETQMSAPDTKFEYGLILKDYDKTIQLAPDFGFAWFNRANILVEQKDYRNAAANYTKAIELENDFAEAYFNRGLTYIYLGDNQRGIADLSKAGELGMYIAYNIIKRFGER